MGRLRYAIKATWIERQKQQIRRVYPRYALHRFYIYLSLALGVVVFSQWAYAGLQETVPQAFVRLVNNILRGRIEPASVAYEIPNRIVLENAVLRAPDGTAAVRVAQATAEISLSDLLNGNIEITALNLYKPLVDMRQSKSPVDGAVSFNLLDALTPRQKNPETGEKPNMTVVLQNIHIEEGQYDLDIPETIHIRAERIAADGNVYVNLKTDVVHIDVNNVAIGFGTVDMPSLAVDLRDLLAKKIVFSANQGKSFVNLDGVTGKGLGGGIGLAGIVDLGGAGSKGELNLRGDVALPSGAWPKKLPKLDFITPAATAKVAITGPFDRVSVDVVGEAQRFTAYGYPIKGGTFDVHVDPKDVVIHQVSASLVGGGVVETTGNLHLADLLLSLDVKASNVPFAVAIRPAELDPLPQGTLWAQAHISGVVDGDSPLIIEMTGKGERLVVSGVNLVGAPVRIESTVVVDPKKKLIELSRTRATGEAWQARLAGTVDLGKESVDLRILDAKADHPQRLVKEIPADVDVDGLTFVGDIRGPYQKIDVTGKATIATGTAYGVKLKEITAKVFANKNRVAVSELSGRACEGHVQGDIDITLPNAQNRRKTLLQGQYRVDGLDISCLRKPDGTAMPTELLGFAQSSNITITGNTDHPVVTGNLFGKKLAVAGEFLDEVSGLFRYEDNVLLLTQLDIKGPLLEAHLLPQTVLTLDMRFADADQYLLDSQIVVKRLSLQEIRALSSRKIDVVGEAISLGQHVTLHGRAVNPEVIANLYVDGLKAGGVPFYDAQLRVGVMPDLLSKNPNYMTAFASWNLLQNRPEEIPSKKIDSTSTTILQINKTNEKTPSQRGVCQGQMSYAIDRDRINADMSLDHFLLAAGMLPETITVPVEGRLSGRIQIKGPLSDEKRNPKLIATLASDALSLSQDTYVNTLGGVLDTENGEKPPTVGQTYISATLNEDGKLDGVVCLDGGRVASNDAAQAIHAWALDKNQLGLSKCPIKADGERRSVIKLFDSSYNVATGDFLLNIGGTMRYTTSPEDGIKPLVPAFERKAIGLGVQAEMDLHMQRASRGVVPEKIGKVTFGESSRITLKKFYIQMEGMPRVEMDEDNRLKLDINDTQMTSDEARFLVDSARVTVGIELNYEQLLAYSIYIRGDDVDLSVLRLFTDSVYFDGTAQLDLTVYQQGDEPLGFWGDVKPKSGTEIYVPSLQDRITWFSGSLHVNFGGGLVLREVILKMDDGVLYAGGTVKVDIDGDGTVEKPYLSDWDVELVASNVTVRKNNVRADVDAHIFIGSPPEDAGVYGATAGQTWIWGDLEIIDGSFYEMFVLSNFILVRDVDTPSEPLSKTLEPMGLSNVFFQIATTLQNFRGRAQLSSFDAKMTLAGDLLFRGSLRIPTIFGSLDVLDGYVQFPQARFEIVSTQIEFIQKSSGTVPAVRLLARSELPPSAEGEVEEPVLLTVSGEINNMQIDLLAEDHPTCYTRADLLGYIILGRTLPRCTSQIAGDASPTGSALIGSDVLLQSLSKELVSTVTDQIERQIERQFGARVQLDLQANTSGVSADWRWEIDRRLDVEGAAGLLGEINTQQNTNLSVTDPLQSPVGQLSSKTNNVDNIKFRFLLVDHFGEPYRLLADKEVDETLQGKLPIEWGRSLVLEMRFLRQQQQSVVLGFDQLGELRLSFRIFEN